MKLRTAPKTLSLAALLVTALLSVAADGIPHASAQDGDIGSNHHLPGKMDFEPEPPTPIGGIALSATSTSSMYWGVSPIVWMQYTVTNTGNVPFHDLAITEDYGSWAEGCDDRRVAPGASVNCWAFVFRQQHKQTIRSAATATTNHGEDLTVFLLTTHHHFDISIDDRVVLDARTVNQPANPFG